MGHYPFTLFNGITLLILAFTILVAAARLRAVYSANWTLLYYAIVVSYTIAFSGGLNPYWVLAGLACALAVRFGLYPSRLRLVELIPLGYIAWRSLGLILMW